MNLQSWDWFLDAEVLIKAKRLHLPVFEMNVIAQLREGGRSMVRLDTCWEFMVNLLRYRFGRAARPDAAAFGGDAHVPSIAKAHAPRKGHDES